MSKNAITIDQIRLACRHVDEMRTAGVSENLAIRTLEIFCDVYAKIRTGGSATPHHVNQVSLWSVEAKKLRDMNPDAKPKDHFRVEHGAPRRPFARKVMGMYQDGNLNNDALNELVRQHWRLAVITLEEDLRLNKIARSSMYDTPEERWAAAGIIFSE